MGPAWADRGRAGSCDRGDPGRSLGRRALAGTGGGFGRGCGQAAGSKGGPSSRGRGSGGTGREVTASVDHEWRWRWGGCLIAGEPGGRPAGRSHLGHCGAVWAQRPGSPGSGGGRDGGQRPNIPGTTARYGPGPATRGSPVGGAPRTPDIRCRAARCRPPHRPWYTAILPAFSYGCLVSDSFLVFAGRHPAGPLLGSGTPGEHATVRRSGFFGRVAGSHIAAEPYLGGGTGTGCSAAGGCDGQAYRRSGSLRPDSQISLEKP